MKAGEAGGLKALYHTKRDQWANRYADAQYHPNADGLYETLQIPTQEVLNENTESLVKVMAWQLSDLPEGEYSVVFMERDYEEVRQSVLAFLNQRIRSQERRDDYLALVKRWISEQPNINVTYLNYRDVVEDPVTELVKLGWPINIEAAAAVVDPARHRYRLEDLTVGVA